MSRRLSRFLIVILVLAVALGAFSILHRLNKTVPNRAVADATPATMPSDPAKPDDHALNISARNPATHPSDTDAGAVHVVPIAELASDARHGSTQFQTSSTTEPSSQLLSDAKAKIEAGKLLDARANLNDALQSGSLDDSDASAVKALLSEINTKVVFGRQHFADDPYGGSYVVKPGEALAKIANAHDCTWELLARINGIEAKKLRAGATIKVIQGPFFAVVSKKKFTMDIYLGGLPGEKSSMYVSTYPVGLGRDDSTPLGTWMVEPHRKLKHPTYYSPRGEGVIAADDPKNPLGGFWIGLTGTEGQSVGKLSYGVHGTIEPDSIGKQSSMGCIRMRNEDVAVVFQLMVEGKSMVVVTN